MRHDTPAGVFFTLWGHLSREAATLAPGTPIKAGTAFARMGTPDENGGWAPHLHFQLGLTDDPDWDGVADPDDRILAATIVALGHQMSLVVVAEGVETEAQRRILLDQGCDPAQGYLFSRPLPVEAFAAAWLASARAQPG